MFSLHRNRPIFFVILVYIRTLKIFDEHFPLGSRALRTSKTMLSICCFKKRRIVWLTDWLSYFSTNSQRPEKQKLLIQLPGDAFWNQKICMLIADYSLKKRKVHIIKAQHRIYTDLTKNLSPLLYNTVKPMVGFFNSDITAKT